MSALFKASSSAAHPDKKMVVLGMDGGGTKTEVLIADLDGNILSSFIGGPTNLAAVPESEALEHLEEALSAAFKRLRHVTVKHAVVGMAGIDTLSDIARFRPFADATLESFGIKQYELLNDSAVALENGTEAENAIILIAGTGSVCYGRNAEGKTARAGGMDYLLADEGSGSWIGRKVLRAVVRARDGRGPETALTPLILKHFKIKAVSQLKQKVYEPRLSKMSIAELAKVWESALLQADSVALQIQKQIVDKLSELVQAVAHSLGFEQQSFDLVLAGSIALLPVVEPQLRVRLKDTYPTINIVIPTLTPAHGAITLALKAAANSNRTVKAV